MIARYACAPLLSLLAACESADANVSHVSPALEYCAPVRSSVPVSEGDVVTVGLHELAIDNGIVRVLYGARGDDFRNTGLLFWGAPVPFNTAEQPFAHVLEARHADAPEVLGNPGCSGAACHDGSGTHWHDAQFSWYGDGAKYSTATPGRDADRVRVLHADDDAIELSYEWDDVALDGTRADGSCVLGYWPLCGPTSIDHTGAPVYVHNVSDQVKAVARAKVWKTVRVERCASGYFVSLRSVPPLIWPEQGERVVRTGYITSAASWTCDGTQSAHHPGAGGHVLYGEQDCIADIPGDQDGHDGWPFLRVVALRHPTPMGSLQYAPDQLGSPGPLMEFHDHIGPDGRPEAWQAFIGAAEYVSPDLSVEPTMEALDLASSLVPQEWPN